MRSPRKPEQEGCCTESGLGKIPRVAGQYTYFVFQDSGDDVDASIGETANITTGVIPVEMPGLDVSVRLA